ncbi:DnaD and phage-associated domain-containing protein [Bacillus cereus BAG6X1-2]|nr:DnaD and phage-associated domain-containing protein [Bacillus cereus BAG6X1-2]
MLFGSQLIEHAVNKAVDENALKWGYVHVILKNWERETVKMLDDVAAIDARFQREKQRKEYSRGNNGKRIEIVPDWLHEDTEPTQKEIKRQHTQSTYTVARRLEGIKVPRGEGVFFL